MSLGPGQRGNIMTTTLTIFARREGVFFYRGLGNILVFHEESGIQGREQKKKKGQS